MSTRSAHSPQKGKYPTGARLRTNEHFISFKTLEEHHKKTTWLRDLPLDLDVNGLEALEKNERDRKS